MAKLFFYKELLSNVFIVDGKPAPFEPLDGNRGVLVLDDTDKSSGNVTLIKELTDADQKRGGIFRISEATYGELKKNHPWNGSKATSRTELLRVLPDPFKAPEPAIKASTEAVAVDKVPALSVPAPGAAKIAIPTASTAPNPAGVAAPGVPPAAPAPASTAFKPATGKLGKPIVPVQVPVDMENLPAADPNA